MAPRPNWKGYLKLSLVSCPVALYPATTTSERVSLRTLNRETGNRVRRQFVDEQTGDAVESDGQIKGYEVAKGEFIQVEDDEIKAVQLESNHTIDIERFVPRDEIDELYLDTPYYLAPTDRVGEEAFAVIRSESVLPTPSPMPPTPTPYAPSSLDAEDRPLAEIDAAEKVGYFSAAPEMTIDVEKSYTATIVTSGGDLVVSLNTEEAPVAVNNFVTLANLGFYDNTRVNQVNPDTLLVIGSPDNTLPNDVGYLFTPETNLSTDPAVGSIAFAPLAPQPDGTIQASGSILLVALAAPPADAKADYGFFGVVSEGLDILAELTAEDTIENITITESE